MDGMFIEIASDSLTTAKVVHVQLPTVVGVRRLKALVAHRCEAGVGVMFCDIDNEDRHRLAMYLGKRPAEKAA